VRRNLAELASNEYDLVIVGGGIFGACAAWDATLRGLSVALLEQTDFAHAASANCFKMIHGGIRYLQHADLVRTRQSTAERSAFLRIAPHLASPLPIFLPTFGHGTKGKEFLGAGMKVYDLLTADRNRHISDPARKIPATRTWSRRETLEAYPFLESSDLTGGALFHDGQIYSPARLALAFLLSATQRGAQAANHAEVTGLLQSGATVHGVAVRDRLDGSEHEVRGRVVLNTTGGWAPHLLGEGEPASLKQQPTFSRDAYFIIKRRLPGLAAVAVSGSTKDPDAIFSRSARHLFLVPWRDRTLVGVWHQVYRGDPAKAHVSEADLAGFLAEINDAAPELKIRRDEVVLTQCGLVLFGENQPGAKDLSYGKRSLLVDHEKHAGLRGLVTLIGVRYTTARAEADTAVRLICQKLGRSAPRCATASTPVAGGDISRFAEFESGAIAAAPRGVSEASIRALVRNHGTAYGDVLAMAQGNDELLATLPESDTLRVEVVHAVRAEMALRLEDVVFRRTDLGTAGAPSSAALDDAATLMGECLSWDEARRLAEIAQTATGFPNAERAA
jgi:glycerol-3-phosphate dehydrogenase